MTALESLLALAEHYEHGIMQASESTVGKS